jgi:capsule polysaccharide export protein KpsE/RkpR
MTPERKNELRSLNSFMVNRVRFTLDAQKDECLDEIDRLEAELAAKNAHLEQANAELNVARIPLADLLKPTIEFLDEVWQDNTINTATAEWAIRERDRLKSITGGKMTADSETR